MAGGPTRYIEGPSGERIITAAGSVAITGARTYAVICRVRSDASGSRSVFTVNVGTTNTDRREGVWFDASAGKLYLAMPPSTGLSSTFAALATGHSSWLLFAVSIPAGSGQTPRATVYNFTSSTGPAHANGATNVDGWAGTPANIYFGDAPGGWELPVDIALFAQFADALDDTERASLAVGVQEWLDLSPVALQEEGWRAASTATPVTDEIGGADQTSVSGTSVNADDGPPGFDWTRGGGEEPSEVSFALSGPAPATAFAVTVGRALSFALSGPAPTTAFTLAVPAELSFALSGPAPATAFAVTVGELAASEVAFTLSGPAPAAAFTLAVPAELSFTLSGPAPTTQMFIRRAAIPVRQEIAEGLSTMAGVTGHARRPAAPRPGDGWPLLSGLFDPEGLAYRWTWRVVIILPQNEALASDWIDERAEELIDALTGVDGSVEAVEPVKLLATGGGEMFAVQATMITGG